MEQEIQIDNYIDYDRQSKDSLLTSLKEILSKKRPGKALALKNLAQAVNSLGTLESIHSKKLHKLENLTKEGKERKKADVEEFTACVLFLDAVAAVQVSLMEYSIAYGVLLDKAVKTYMEVRRGEYIDNSLEGIDLSIIEAIRADSKAIHLPDLDLPVFSKVLPSQKVQPTKAKPALVIKIDKEVQNIVQLPQKVKDFFITLRKDNWDRKAKRLHQTFPEIFPKLDVTAIKTKMNG